MHIAPLSPVCSYLFSQKPKQLTLGSQHAQLSHGRLEGRPAQGSSLLTLSTVVLWWGLQSLAISCFLLKP